MAYKLKELNFADLTDMLFKDFNRDQEVKKCWRQENGEWILKDIAFTEKWNAANYRVLTKCLRNTIQSGGTVYGAFDQEKLRGFASLENVFMGSRKQYLQLSGIHVSCEYRGGGIGKKLFHLIAAKARRVGAEKLYISAHSAEETQAFYQALGCADAGEIQADLAASEPCDRQLEYDLNRLIIRHEQSAENHIAENTVGRECKPTIRETIMSIDIQETKDAAVIAELNRTVQNLHVRKYPEYFKPYDYQAVLDSMTEMLARENWFAFVARADEQPVGYVLFYIRDYKENPFHHAYCGLHIDQIAVKEEFQHRNIGSLLMDKAEEFAKNRGITQLELTYWDKNTEAGNFYAKRGFGPGLHFVIRKM